MLVDGQIVAYVGGATAHAPLELGDEGRVLEVGNTAAHVQWTTGACEGDVGLIAHDHLVPAVMSAHASVADELDDSLASPSAPRTQQKFLSFSARSVFDAKGGAGVLRALRREGGLAGFERIADEVVALAATRVREDGVFVEALAGLDADEGAEVVHVAVMRLLRSLVTEDDI